MRSLATAARQTLDATTIAALRRCVEAATHPLRRATLIGLAPCLAQKKAPVEFRPLSKS